MKSDPGAGGTSLNDSTDDSAYEIQVKIKSIYKEAQAAVQALMAFLADLQSGQQPLAVTYFDEAQGLGALFSVPLRLMRHQSRSTKMWYVFATEKLTINCFTPSRGSCESSGLACVLISSQYISTFSAASSRNTNIYAPILCIGLRPERY